MTRSLLSGFYKLSVEQRIELLISNGFLVEEDANTLRDGSPLLLRNVADKMVENVVGVFGLPFAIAPNLVVNGRDYLVPMVLEEPSVVAGLSSAAKLVQASGGFQVTSTTSIMIGQVQIMNIAAADEAMQMLQESKDEILKIANEEHLRLKKRGGGAKDFELFKYQQPDKSWMVIMHLLVDTKDAMGANIVNSMCERIASHIETICGGEVLLRILSNLVDKALVSATANIRLCTLGPDECSSVAVRDNIVLANDFANIDPHRAATHNKGIMNGIDAVAIATGNDWRAIEAGIHAFAAKDGIYRSLTRWFVAENGDLAGQLTIPLKVGIVGGSLRANPGAVLGLKITGVKSAIELAELMAAVGLAQNFSALRALVSTGIQHGHMGLHARSVAASANVSSQDFDEVVQQLIKSGEIKSRKATEIAEQISCKRKERKYLDCWQGKGHGKVILFGEHAAVYDRHALALPLKDAVAVQLSEGSGGMTLTIPDWKIDNTWGTCETGPEGLSEVVNFVIKELGLTGRAFDIRASAKIPLGMGLGSSAAFSVALIRAFNMLFGGKDSDEEINRMAFKCEEITHGYPSGIDNNLATFGKPILYSKLDKTQGGEIKLEQCLPILVAHSGSQSDTKKMVEAVRYRYKNNEPLYNTIFDEIDKMAASGASALCKAHYDYLGSLMNVCHGFLNAIEVSTPELERMVRIAREAGAIGAKLTGAGGGGSIIALCPDNMLAVSRALEASGYNTFSMEQRPRPKGI
ncbi:MAG: hydroxymethylglutaryl-CoA reductase [Woeseia sp.]|nr:hydroxymethylglutaryl-CoA reductase [Woeseia sp.]